MSENCEAIKCQKVMAILQQHCLLAPCCVMFDIYVASRLNQSYLVSTVLSDLLGFLFSSPNYLVTLAEKMGGLHIDVADNEDFLVFLQLATKST